jgi:hypothetical protein
MVKTQDTFEKKQILFLGEGKYNRLKATVNQIICVNLLPVLQYLLHNYIHMNCLEQIICNERYCTAC